MKKLLAIILSLIIIVSMSVTTYAAEVSNVVTEDVAEQTVTPRINWDGTAWLGTDGYYTITTSNNIFGDRPLVKSDGNNDGDVTIRVLDESGQQVGTLKTVSPGSSVRLDRIPYNAGTYRIQGKATKAGNFYFEID